MQNESLSRIHRCSVGWENPWVGSVCSSSRQCQMDSYSPDCHWEDGLVPWRWRCRRRQQCGYIWPLFFDWNLVSLLLPPGVHIWLIKRQLDVDILNIMVSYTWIPKNSSPQLNKYDHLRVVSVKMSKWKEIKKNLYQGCVLGLVQTTGTSNFFCQYMCWIWACQHRPRWCPGKLEWLDWLAPASPATCYFPDVLSTS